MVLEKPQAHFPWQTQLKNRSHSLDADPSDFYNTSPHSPITWEADAAQPFPQIQRKLTSQEVPQCLTAQQPSSLNTLTPTSQV